MQFIPDDLSSIYGHNLHFSATSGNGEDYAFPISFIVWLWIRASRRILQFLSVQFEYFYTSINTTILIL